MPHVVEIPVRLGAVGFLGGFPVAAAEETEVDMAAARAVPRLSSISARLVSGETLDTAYEQWLLPGREQIPGDPSDEDQAGRPGSYELIASRWARRWTL